MSTRKDTAMNTPMTAMPWPAGAHFTPAGPLPERLTLIHI